MLRLLALLVPLAATPPFTFTPPPGFHPDLELARSDSDSFAPVLEGDGERHLVAYFVDGEGPAGSSISISLVEGRLDAEPSLRPILASATATYFRSRLELPFDLDRAVIAGKGSRRRIDVWGRTTVGEQSRQIVVSYFPGARRHAIVISSLSGAREDSIRPLLGGSLDTFVEDDAPEPWARSQTAISIGLWGMAGLVLATLGVLRRRRDQKDQNRP